MKKRVTLKSLDAKIDRGLKRLDKKIDGVEQRLDAKIDGVEQRLDAKIDGVEQRLDAKIDEAVHTLRADIRHSHRELAATMGSMSAAILTIATESREHREAVAKKAEQERLEALEHRVDDLEAKAS